MRLWAGRKSILAAAALLGAITILGLSAAWWRSLSGGHDAGDLIARLPDPLANTWVPGFDSRLPRDGIPPIYKPEFIPPHAANLDPNELVMAVVIEGDARAYPVATLTRREMVNDTVGGTPILVTW